MMGRLSSEAMDKKKNGPASVWPQQRPSSKPGQKCTQQTLKYLKKDNFCCIFIQIFLNAKAVFMALKNGFRPNLLDLKEKF